MMRIIVVIIMIMACSPCRTSPIWGYATRSEDVGSSAPTVKPWPEQFHATIFTNYSGALQMVDLWYDWPNGRNLNIEQDQLAQLPLYNVEWTNGTSFFFTQADDHPNCQIVSFEVGILRPNWMDGGNYLGQRHMDGFLCNVWEKADGFIWYYEDVLSKRPVYWLLFSGKETHIMTFEVGAVLEDTKWQAPAYCFPEKTDAIAGMELTYKFDMIRFQQREKSVLKDAIVSLDRWDEKV